MSRETKAKELLEQVARNESVSKWDVYRCRREIRKLIRENIEFEDLSHEIECIIDLASESL